MLIVRPYFYLPVKVNTLNGNIIVDVCDSLCAYWSYKLNVCCCRSSDKLVEENPIKREAFWTVKSFAVNLESFKFKEFEPGTKNISKYIFCHV